MELTELQKKILDAPEDKIVVEASAAAGKTRLLTEKVRQLLRAGVNPSSIAVITFTRLSAQELISRLEKDYHEGIFIGTIHALAARFLAINGMGNYINKAAEEEDFDKLFYLCGRLDLLHSYSWMLVDEAQDCGESELRFIFDLIQPEHYFFALDFNQSIYSFRGARPDLVKEYLKDATYYSLNENFRNGSVILQEAKDALAEYEMYDDSVAMREEEGMYKKSRYSKRELVQWINLVDSYKDWAILCRTNADKDKIIADLEAAGIPVITFKQGEINRAQLNDLMNRDVVKVLTVHSSKGLEWNNVVIYRLWWKNKNPEERRLIYVGMTRARNLLIKYS